MSLLVDYGASFDAVDKNGATALHLAAGLISKINICTVIVNFMLP